MNTPALLPADQLQRPPAGAVTHLLRGAVRYYHYGQGGTSDHGWGCGYRTVQTMLSWLATAPPPSVPELQAVLSRAHPAAFPGPRGWIGVNDAVVLVDDIHGAAVEVVTLPSGGSAATLLPRLAEHFDSGGGPVMVGGGGDPYSKTVLGVATRPPALLIADPHYGGPPLEAAEASRLESLWREGWIAWKPLRICLPSSSFYNFGLLRRPEGGAARAAAPKPSVADACEAWAGEIEVVESGSGMDDSTAPAPAQWDGSIEVVGSGFER